MQILADKTTWQYVLKTISEFPAVIPFVFPPDFRIESVKDLTTSFLPEIAIRWTNGPILQGEKMGMRNLSTLLIVDHKNIVLHDESTTLRSLGDFVRILEQSILEKKFGYCVFVATTNWHGPNKTDIIGKTVEVQIRTLADSQKNDSPEDIRANLVVNYGLLHYFSEPFRKDFFDYAEEKMTCINEELQKRPDSEKILSEDYGFVSIKMGSFHNREDIVLFTLKNNEGEVTLMVSNHGKDVQIQSFNSSIRNAKKILEDTLNALETTADIERMSVAL
ncbi:MAG: hypothetical protein AAB631_01075 [Patescibacteria group bacterium]